MSLSPSLSNVTIADTYIQALLAGDRVQTRQVIEDCLNLGVSAEEVLTKLVWPVMEQIQTLYRDNQISKAGLNFATRLNRMIADQMAAKLDYAQKNGKRVLIFCGDDEPEELGGQICADLFDAGGYEVRFAGGGVPNDEILSLIGEYRPKLMVMFATKPAGVPNVRRLFDYLREVNSTPDMQIMCCGGIYKRAEGLAEEIGADLYAPDAADAVRIASENPLRRATSDQHTVGRGRRVRTKGETRRAVDAEAA